MIQPANKNKMLTDDRGDQGSVMWPTERCRNLKTTLQNEWLRDEGSPPSHTFTHSLAHNPQAIYTNSHPLIKGLAAHTCVMDESRLPASHAVCVSLGEDERAYDATANTTAVFLIGGFQIGVYVPRGVLWGVLGKCLRTRRKENLQRQKLETPKCCP